MEISLTPSAKARLSVLQQKLNYPDPKLRVYIIGGGCSGFQYGFEFEPEAKEVDFVFQQEEVTMIVDPLSYQYLRGSTIDYVENLQGAKFSVNNPNAETTCGCGSSFSLKST